MAAKIMKRMVDLEKHYSLNPSEIVTKEHQSIEKAVICWGTKLSV